jgi:hypothetical protein
MILEVLSSLFIEQHSPKKFENHSRRMIKNEPDSADAGAISIAY